MLMRRDANIHADRRQYSARWTFNIALAAAVLIASLLLRFPTFFRSVINWDESLYFLMAEQWRAGHLPYTALWDNKPIGIYAIFAFFQSVFGDGIASIRIATVVAVTVTTLCVIRIASLIPHFDRRLGMACAGLAGAAFAIGSLSNDGLAANAELFMTAFTALAVVCSVSPDVFAGRPMLRGLTVGLLLGLAFMTKYVVVLEFPAVAFALLFLHPPRGMAQTSRLILGGLVGGLLPIALAALLYSRSGVLDLWFDASIASNFRRATAQMAPLDLSLALRFIKWTPLFAAAAILFAFAPLIGRGGKDKPADPLAGRFHIFLMLWIVGAFLGVSAAKSFYSHYFLQVLPALCVALAWAALKLIPAAASRSPLRMAGLAALILVIPALAAAAALYGQVETLMSRRGAHIAFHPDAPTLIAGDIVKASGAAPPRLYVFDHEPIIYSLAAAPLPTRYAYPAFLTTCFLERVARIDAPAEVGRILATRPEFIVRTLDSIAKLPIDPASYAELESAVSARYDIWGRYDGAIVYRLRPADRQALTAPPPGPGSCGPDSKQVG